jgi:hypothetical protein
VAKVAKHGVVKMTSLSSRSIEALRRDLALRPAGSDSKAWVGRLGRRCPPLLRRKDIREAILFSLVNEFAATRIITQRELFERLW